MIFLLRIIEEAHVALVRHSKGSCPEMLPTRYDLYKYRGGICWGYKGSGVANLSFAIAARYCEYKPSSNIPECADLILNKILCNLDKDTPHDIDQTEIQKILDDEGI